MGAEFHRLGLGDWLDELTEGIDTPVGERGGALSVGERQLVTLVRAAIADPDLLVLDEATSAVDPATEVRINRALGELTTGRTVVTIAHRMSTAERPPTGCSCSTKADWFKTEHTRNCSPDGGVYQRLYQSWQTGHVGADLGAGQIPASRPEGHGRTHRTTIAAAGVAGAVTCGLRGASDRWLRWPPAVRSTRRLQLSVGLRVFAAGGRCTEGLHEHDGDPQLRLGLRNNGDADAVVVTEYVAAVAPETA